MLYKKGSQFIVLMMSKWEALMALIRGGVWNENENIKYYIKKLFQMTLLLLSITSMHHILF